MERRRTWKFGLMDLWNDRLILLRIFIIEKLLKFERCEQIELLLRSRGQDCVISTVKLLQRSSGRPVSVRHCQAPDLREC